MRAAEPHAVEVKRTDAATAAVVVVAKLIVTVAVILGASGGVFHRRH